MLFFSDILFFETITTKLIPLTFAVLPKQGSVFVFAVPLHSTEAAVINSGTNDGEAGCGRGRTVQDGAHIELELYGNQFRFRAADRAGRKFKHKESIVL